jgi:hypothetical protein
VDVDELFRMYDFDEEHERGDEGGGEELCEEFEFSAFFKLKFDK